MSKSAQWVHGDEEDSEMVVLPDSVSDSLEDQVAVKPPFGTT